MALLLFILFNTGLLAAGQQNQDAINYCGSSIELTNTSIHLALIHDEYIDSVSVNVSCKIEIKVDPSSIMRVGAEINPDIYLGMQRESTASLEGTYPSYKARKNVGINLVNSDSTQMLTPDYLFYSFLSIKVQFNRLGCLKNGVPLDPGENYCYINKDYYPTWGTVRDRQFISKGHILTLEYYGKPIEDFFNITFYPIHETCPSTAKCQNACLVTDNNDCRCPDPHYKGDDCKEDVDECVEFDACNHYLERCNNTKDGYECNCRTGYKRDKDDENENSDFEECVDINECTLNKTVNDDGEDVIIDPCEAITSNATCANIDGGFECQCHEGFVKIDEKCTETCESTLLDCGKGGVCFLNKTNNAKPQCKCKDGYEGEFCELLCGERDCQNNGTCVVSNKKAACQCTTDFEGIDCHIRKHICKLELLKCLNISDTSSTVNETEANIANCQPCKHGGYCLRDDDSVSGFSCKCTQDYIGRRCTLRYNNNSNPVEYLTSIMISTIFLIYSVIG